MGSKVLLWVFVTAVAFGLAYRANSPRHEDIYDDEFARILVEAGEAPSKDHTAQTHSCWHMAAHAILQCVDSGGEPLYLENHDGKWKSLANEEADSKVASAVTTRLVTWTLAPTGAYLLMLSYYMFVAAKAKTFRSASSVVRDEGSYMSVRTGASDAPTALRGGRVEYSQADEMKDVTVVIQPMATVLPGGIISATAGGVYTNQRRTGTQWLNLREVSEADAVQRCVFPAGVSAHLGSQASKCAAFQLSDFAMFRFRWWAQAHKHLFFAESRALQKKLDVAVQQADKAYKKRLGKWSSRQMTLDPNFNVVDFTCLAGDCVHVHIAADESEARFFTNDFLDLSGGGRVMIGLNELHVSEWFRKHVQYSAEVLSMKKGR